MSELEIRADGGGDALVPLVVAQRIQLRFTKGAAIRFISHLDLLRTFERAMRRAKLPLAFSQGFNPRPRFSIYIPLPVGATSEAELANIDLAERLPLGEVTQRLNAVLPPSIRVLDEEEIPFEGPHASSQIDTAEYLVEAVAGEDVDPAIVQSIIEEFLNAEHWPYLRSSDKKGSREVDLRQPVLALEFVEAEGTMVRLRMEINIGGEGGARPREVIAALSTKIPGLEDRRVHRSKLYNRSI